MSMNIAIDGPAGAGKSTIAKSGWRKNLDLSMWTRVAMYRAMAYYFLQHNIDAKDENAIAAACPDVDVTITYENGEQQVLLNGENVNGVIRNEEVGNMASSTSVYPVVRKKLSGTPASACKVCRKCHHGWKRYWNVCSSGRTGQNLSDSKFCDTGKEKIR